MGSIVHIVDEEGNELPTGEAGVVCFERADGERSFEYHKDPAKTDAAFEAHGWSTVGDMGYLDDDGYLYLTDRRDFMIVSGGVNIYPQEAENLLITHPKVMDAAVFGVPNAEMGEEVKAVVQPIDWANAGADLERELIAFCRSHLAHYKCPRRSTSSGSSRASRPASSTSASSATVTGPVRPAASSESPPAGCIISDWLGSSNRRGSERRPTARVERTCAYDGNPRTTTSTRRRGPELQRESLLQLLRSRTGLGGWIRMGNRPNEAYAEMTVCLYLPDGRVGFMFKRPRIEGHEAHDAGGLRFEVVAPYEEHRVTYDGDVCVLADPRDMADPRSAFANNPHEPCAVDLRLIAVAPPSGGEPEWDEGEERPPGSTHDSRAATPNSTWRSPVSSEVGAQQFDLTAGLGLRDHSWGPRIWQSIWWYRWITASFGPLGIACTLRGERDLGTPARQRPRLRSRPLRRRTAGAGARHGAHVRVRRRRVPDSQQRRRDDR